MRSISARIITARVVLNILVNIFVLGMCAIALSPQMARAERDATADPALVQADHRFVQAVARNDKSALLGLLDSDFLWTDFGGKSLSKSQVLQNVPKPLIAAENDAESKAYDYGQLGDVQVNAGRAHVLRIWVKRTGGWKAVVYQEVLSLDAPPSFAPGAGKDCENPCKRVPFKPENETQRQVITTYSKLETAAMAHNSAVFATVVANEFAAASSNSNKLYDKRSRMDDFDHSKMEGVAPTPLTSARMMQFGNAVLMISEHTPDRGKPLHVTRLWVKQRDGWVEALSYQTSVRA
jgi:hypothetical protein